jgi:HK97 gp10 family phage protein
MGSMRSQQAAWFRARAARRVTAFARQLRKAEALGAEGAEIASYLRHERGQAIRARELAARRLRAARRQFVSAAAADYPRMRTGHLRRNVQMEMDRQRIEARVGTNVVYGRYLEFGTSKMAARPWLSRGFRETAAEIRRILTTPIGSPI